ncbi:WXG100 family type VII secretion target [Streptomyces sp. BBFR2]|uniref:WXG100 family type VII secretion target n=1 Tax=Streptomyces sp. BBFR2 TaxID=3372854 RepID=UPI0037DA7733
MSGGNFQVTAEEMVAFSGKIDSVAQAIDGEIRRLGGTVENVSSAWKGQAATRYHQLQTQVNEDATRINQLLKEIKEAIDQTTGNYTSSEEDQAASISHIDASPFG